jgi:lysophospholipase L1-like esterase
VYAQRSTSGALSLTSTARPILYLALGDSYTIGTGASHESRNFPTLLAASVREASGREVEVVNPAVNGFTTIDLIAKELGYITDLKPDLVSVLIGVNDLVQGRGSQQYSESLVEIYDAIAATQLPAGRVAAISIPNWSVVPAARDFGDPARLRGLTELFNAVAKQEAEARRFTWVDLTEVSTRAMGSTGWIAADELHPGDAQYAAWAEEIWPHIRDAWSSL